MVNFVIIVVQYTENIKEKKDLMNINLGLDVTFVKIGNIFNVKKNMENILI